MVLNPASSEQCKLKISNSPGILRLGLQRLPALCTEHFTDSWPFYCETAMAESGQQPVSPLKRSSVNEHGVTTSDDGEFVAEPTGNNKERIKSSEELW